MGTVEVSSHIRSLMIGSEMVPNTLFYFDNLTQVMAQEDSAVSSNFRHEHNTNTMGG